MLAVYWTLFNYYFIALVLIYIYACIVRYFKRPISKVLEEKYELSTACLILGVPALFGYIMDFAVYTSSKEPIYLGPIFGTILLVVVVVMILVSFLTEYRKNIPDSRI